MNSEPKRKRSRLVPAAIVGAIALILAAQYLNFGIGPGSGAQDETASKDKSETVAERIGDKVQEIVDDTQQLVADKKDESQKPENAYVGLDVANVLIDGDEYLLLTVPESLEAAEPLLAQTGDPQPEIGQRRSVAIYEIARLARELPGDQAGIRVRIFRTENSTADAAEKLLAALYAADLKDDQVDYRQTLVE